MADTPTPAPAGAESAPVPMNEDQILQELARYGDDGVGDDDGPSAEDQPEEETEQTEPEASAEPEGEEGASEEEGSEDEGPEDDASEPEPENDAQPKDTKEDKILVSRDGEKVPVSELWKARDRAREFDRILPQVQQEHQRFQQAQQQFAAEKQQFNSFASGIAQVALGFLPPEPDNALMDRNSPSYDPIAWQEQKFARDRAVVDFNQKFAGIAQAQGQAAQQAQQQAAHQVQTERRGAVERFFSAHPELRAPEKGQEFIKDFHAVADAVGYTREERADVRDPRLYRLTMLAARGLKAMQAEQQQKTVTTQRQSIAAKKVASAPPVTPPAARQTAATRDARTVQASVERLRKNPSDQKAALEALAQFE